MGVERSKRLRSKGIWAGLRWAIAFTLCLLLLYIPAAHAGPLGDRLAQFPQWTSPPPTQPANGDLAYPDWFQGTWQATSTLVDLAAPLAPEVNSPGFEGNKTLLEQPVDFTVRFVPRRLRRSLSPALPGPVQIVADRAFNGLNIARAYLGKDLVVRVDTDPQDPNRQVTILRGNRSLVSTIPARAIETEGDRTFTTSEIFQQVFRGTGNPYLNQVETTTAYRYYPDDDSEYQEPVILADQVTAVYLSPQDENYFKAANRPIALYRYRLDLRPVVPAALPPAAAVRPLGDGGDSGERDSAAV